MKNKQEIYIDNNKIFIKTKFFFIEKNISEIKKIFTEKIYGSFLYYIFGAGLIEKPKFYNDFCKEIKLKILFNNGEWIVISLKTGDDFMQDESEEKIEELLKKCLYINPEIEQEKISKANFLFKDIILR